MMKEFPLYTLTEAFLQVEYLPSHCPDLSSLLVQRQLILAEGCLVSLQLLTLSTGLMGGLTIRDMVQVLLPTVSFYSISFVLYAGSSS